MQEAHIAAKASKWLKLNSTRYADKRKYGAVTPPKEMLPVEHLRKVRPLVVVVCAPGDR